MRGGFGGDSSGRSFDNNLYADYSGPDSGTSGGAYSGGSGFGGAGFEAEPSQQIMVRNLPWSTTNEDLVELFETTGTVELAEILFDGARSKGAGVVQFANVQEAETAIGEDHLSSGGDTVLRSSLKSQLNSSSTCMVVAR